MVEKKTIALSVVSLLTLAILGGVLLTDNDVYYCEDRSMVMQCDKLSKYYGLENGKCWNEDVGNKLCRSGWLEVTGEIAPVIDNSARPIQYSCSATGCIPI